MAEGASKSLSTKSLDSDEEFHEFCENFKFSGSVSIIFDKIESGIFGTTKKKYRIFSE